MCHSRREGYGERASEREREREGWVCGGGALAEETAQEKE